MSRNASGTYSLPSPENPVVAGTVVKASDFNTTMQDVAAALTESVSRNGQGTMLQPFKLVDGTVSAPGLSWGSETTSGLYRISTNQFGFSVAGVQLARFATTGLYVTGQLVAQGATGLVGVNVGTAEVRLGRFSESDNSGYAGTVSNTPFVLAQAGAGRVWLPVGGGVVVNANSRAGIGSSADHFSVNGQIGFIAQLNAAPGLANPLQIVNRSVEGYIEFYTNAATLAASLNRFADLTVQRDIYSGGGYRAVGVNFSLSSGAGAEMYQAGGVAIFRGYNRSTSSDIPTIVQGQTLSLAVGAGNAIAIDSSRRVNMDGQPSFMAYFNEGQIQTSGSTIVFPNERHEIGAFYNPSNGIATAPVTGKYLVAVDLHMFIAAGAGSGTPVGPYSLQLRVNGNSEVGKSVWGIGGTTVTVGFNRVLNLSAGDQVTLVSVTSLSSGIIYQFGGSTFSMQLLS